MSRWNDSGRNLNQSYHYDGRRTCDSLRNFLLRHLDCYPCDSYHSLGFYAHRPAGNQCFYRDQSSTESIHWGYGIAHISYPSCLCAYHLVGDSLCTGFLLDETRDHYDNFGMGRWHAYPRGVMRSARGQRRSFVSSYQFGGSLNTGKVASNDERCHRCGRIDSPYSKILPVSRGGIAGS